MRAIQSTATRILIGGDSRAVRVRLRGERAVAAGEARTDAHRVELFYRHSARLGAAEDALGRSGSAGNLADFLRRHRVPAAMRSCFRRSTTGR